MLVKQIKVNEVLYDIVASYQKEAPARTFLHKNTGLKILHHFIRGHKPWIVLRPVTPYYQETPNVNR